IAVSYGFAGLFNIGSMKRVWYEKPGLSMVSAALREVSFRFGHGGEWPRATGLPSSESEGLSRFVKRLSSGVERLRFPAGVLYCEATGRQDRPTNSPKG